MRKAATALAILLLVIGAGAWLAWNSLDVLVKWGLEHYGPDVTGTTVDVGSVRISPRDGRGSIARLDIGNPRGFGSPRAARCGTIRVALEPKTVLEDVVHIRELAIESAEIAYERGEKASNLDAIQQAIERYAKSPEGRDGGQGGTSKPKRRYVIDRLTIRGTRVVMTNARLKGQGIQFDLPDLVMSDIGRSRGGLPAGEVAAQVASAMQQRIAQKVLTNVDALRKGGVEGAIDALRGLLK